MKNYQFQGYTTSNYQTARIKDETTGKTFVIAASKWKASQKFGRLIGKHEKVRFLDGDKTNFSKKNLEIYEPQAHGTIYRYNLGCRCHACKKAQSDYMFAWKGTERKNTKRAKHSLSGYLNRKCLCITCTKAYYDNYYKKKYLSAS